MNRGCRSISQKYNKILWKEMILQIFYDFPSVWQPFRVMDAQHLAFSGVRILLRVLASSSTNVIWSSRRLILRLLFPFASWGKICPSLIFTFYIHELLKRLILQFQSWKLSFIIQPILSYSLMAALMPFLLSFCEHVQASDGIFLLADIISGWGGSYNSISVTFIRK